MPNQRDTNKDLIGGYISKDLKKEVLRVAEASGKTVTEILEESLLRGVTRHVQALREPVTYKKPKQIKKKK